MLWHCTSTLFLHFVKIFCSRLENTGKSPVRGEGGAQVVTGRNVRAIFNFRNKTGGNTTMKLDFAGLASHRHPLLGNISLIPALSLGGTRGPTHDTCPDLSSDKTRDKSDMGGPGHLATS